jgi:hypothetical protein
MENWVRIDGFPKYTISSDGEVRHISSQRSLTPQINQSGVPYVVLMRDWTHCSRALARLVARAYLPRPSQAFDTPINLDGDRFNCAVENLMWRPRWFAVQYHRQFTDAPAARVEAPLRASESSEVHFSSLEAASRYGLLEHDVVRSVLHGTYVWPTNQQFELVEGGF